MGAEDAENAESTQIAPKFVVSDYFLRLIYRQAWIPGCIATT